MFPMTFGSFKISVDRYTNTLIAYNAYVALAFKLPVTAEAGQ